MLSRPPGQEQLDWLQHFAAAKHGTRPAAAEQALVHVVVQDQTEMVEVIARQGAAQFFRQRIADAIRVPCALALDNLDGLHADGGKNPEARFAVAWFQQSVE